MARKQSQELASLFINPPTGSELAYMTPEPGEKFLSLPYIGRELGNLLLGGVQGMIPAITEDIAQRQYTNIRKQLAEQLGILPENLKNFESWWKPAEKKITEDIEKETKERVLDVLKQRYESRPYGKGKKLDEKHLKQMIENALKTEPPLKISKRIRPFFIQGDKPVTGAGFLSGLFQKYSKDELKQYEDLINYIKGRKNQTMKDIINTAYKENKTDILEKFKKFLIEKGGYPADIQIFEKDETKLDPEIQYIKNLYNKIKQEKQARLLAERNKALSDYYYTLHRSLPPLEELMTIAQGLPTTKTTTTTTGKVLKNEDFLRELKFINDIRESALKQVSNQLKTVLGGDENEIRNNLDILNNIWGGVLTQAVKYSRDVANYNNVLTAVTHIGDRLLNLKTSIESIFLPGIKKGEINFKDIGKSEKSDESDANKKRLVVYNILRILSPEVRDSLANITDASKISLKNFKNILIDGITSYYLNEIKEGNINNLINLDAIEINSKIRNFVEPYIDKLFQSENDKGAFLYHFKDIYNLSKM